MCGLFFIFSLTEDSIGGMGNFLKEGYSMIAHLRASDEAIQTVQEHVEAVSFYAGEFGRKAGFKSIATLAGFLHDMGKSTEAFRTYIQRAVQGSDLPLERIDHSTAGAKYLYERYYVQAPKNSEDILSNLTVEVIGMVILSHHSGLQNFIQPDGKVSDFFRRVCLKDLPYYEEVKHNFFHIPGSTATVHELYDASLEEMKAFLQNLQNLMKKRSDKGSVSRNVFLSIAMKFVFSCLIDADRTDARKFDENDRSEFHHNYASYFKESEQRLENQLQKWQEEQDPSNPIDRLRAQMSDQCSQLAASPSSIYTLSIPTGGGKTLASLRYALKHAQKYNKDRIIYVVPYTTILEQNAAAVRKIIEKNDIEQISNVLEHHSNVIDNIGNEDDTDYYTSKQKKQMELARDNWDYPIIFTTMVQFLDAFYAKGTRKSRRLHNLANAVIIFDEVQSVPIKHLPLFNSAVNFLRHFGKSSILLCTATQPELAKTNYPLLLGEDIEMVDQLPQVVKAFERVSITNKITKDGWNAQEIDLFVQEKLQKVHSILLILNTKKAVLHAYEQLKELDDVTVYHLSTSMCPQHRKNMFAQMIKQLGDPDKKIVCVSTQLIEAGVDISFECVIRSLAGLDSIAQAAGRCNRNNEYEIGKVYIIRASDESLTRLPEIELGQKVMEENVLRKKKLAKDLLSPLAIQTYFEFYLARAERELNMQDPALNVQLIELVDQSKKYFAAIPKKDPKTMMRSMYKTLESHFSVIEAPTTGVIVPYGKEGKELIASLNEEQSDYEYLNMLLKEAQQYSVNVYSHTLRELEGEGLLYPLYQEGIYALHETGYSDDYGISLEGEGEWSNAIF